MQQFGGDYTVDESGMINLPYIGQVKAGGLPPSAVQTPIQNQLISAAIYTNPTITVSRTAGERVLRISVGGAVKGAGTAGVLVRPDADDGDQRGGRPERFRRGQGAADSRREGAIFQPEETEQGSTSKDPQIEEPGDRDRDSGELVLGLPCCSMRARFFSRGSRRPEMSVRATVTMSRKVPPQVQMRS